jgi:eukaryotic translation initiation factor 2C
VGLISKSIILTKQTICSYLEGQVHSRNANLSPLISALNIVLQSHASKTGVRVGKNRYFFKQLAKKMLLGPGIEARKGFFASVRPAYKQLMVNVNVCMTPFYVPGNLADAIMSFQKSSMGAMPRRFAQNVIVTTQHLKRKQRKSIYDICDKTAQQQTFHCSDYGEDMSVAQYFQKSGSHNPSLASGTHPGLTFSRVWYPAQTWT